MNFGLGEMSTLALVWDKYGSPNLIIWEPFYTIYSIVITKEVNITFCKRYVLLYFNLFIVPFAVEEKSGTITVVDDLKKFNRENYDFEAVVTNEKDLSLVTNVTIHVVDPQDEKTILMK